MLRFNGGNSVTIIMQGYILYQVKMMLWFNKKCYYFFNVAI